MKIAYLWAVHKDPQLLQRAIATLSSQDCGFFVHVDRKSSLREFSSIVGESIFRLEPRVAVYWAEFSQVEATMLLVRQALASSANYDYFVFLQGATYPLRSGKYIQSFLEKHRDHEFMNLVKMPAPGYPLSKISTLRYPSNKPIRRFVTRALAKVGLAHRNYARHLGGLEPYAGHACWALSRDACHYVEDFVTSNRHLEQYFQNTFAPDESFFHTILGNSPFQSRITRNVVYADWSKSLGHHPAILDDQHVARFEAQERVCVEDEWGAGEMLFARKLSDDVLHLVDRIDAMIRQKEEIG